MKELTNEENAKVYTELINRLEDVKDAIKKQNYGIAMEILCKPYTPFQVITHSELIKSEDEKIRNEIIAFVEQSIHRGGGTHIPQEKENKWIAWLEKQSEQKANVVVRRFLIGDTFIDKYNPTNVFTVTEYIENGIAYVDQSGERFTKYYDDSWDDYQLIEQKTADNVEPKFKVGDAIRLKNSNAEYIIESISDGHYYGKGFSISIVGGNRDYELVEQKPKEYAKGEDYGIDGLYNAIRILEKTLGKVDGYQTDDGILEHECAISAVKSLYDQKPAWSEEDEQYLLVCKNALAKYQVSDKWDATIISRWLEDKLKSIKDRVQPQPKQEWSEEDSKNMKECVIAISMSEGHTLEEKEQLEDWLKYHLSQKQCGYNPYKEVVESIAEMCEKYKLPTSNLSDFLDNVKVKCKEAKEYDAMFPQNTWKPTEKHIQYLQAVVNDANNAAAESCNHVLKDLLEQLKELKG